MCLLLDISRALRAPGEEIPFLHRDAIPPQEIFGETVEFSDVLLSGYFSSVDESLRIWGTLRAVAHGHCAGCLKPVDYQVEVPFDETFIRQSRYPQKEETLEETFYGDDGFEADELDLEGFEITDGVGY